MWCEINAERQCVLQNTTAPTHHFYVWLWAVTYDEIIKKKTKAPFLQKSHEIKNTLHLLLF
jgi:hypothetical protein